jgi:uncharacterized membrane protein YgcG
MPDSSKNKSISSGTKNLSRRRFIEKSLFGAALAGTAVMPAWAPLRPPMSDADLLHEVQGKAKVSKRSARYQDSPKGSQQCSGCTHFRGGTCEIVEGQISPNGWCRHFKAKGKSSGRGKKSSSSGGSSGKSGGGGSSGY